MFEINKKIFKDIEKGKEFPKNLTKVFAGLRDSINAFEDIDISNLKYKKDKKKIKWFKRKISKLRFDLYKWEEKRIRE
jgi:hypothetical protein